MSGPTPEPADVELLARAMYDDQRGEGEYDAHHRAGYWHQEARDHAASALRALAAAGRLAPSDVDTLWSVRFADGTVLTSPTFTKAGAYARAAEHSAAGDPAGARQLRGESE